MNRSHIKAFSLSESRWLEKQRKDLTISQTSTPDSETAFWHGVSTAVYK